MSENKKEEIIVEKKTPKVNEPKQELSKNTENTINEVQLAEEKALRSAKRKESIGKFFKGIGSFLWKTLSIKVLFIILFAIGMFIAGFYAGEENYKRRLRTEYEKAVEDFADTWEKEWKEAFEK